jgi:hypothetical protein
MRRRAGCKLLFPAPRWRLSRPRQLPQAQLKPAQQVAGIEPFRRIFELRDTFATSRSVPASRFSKLFVTLAPAGHNALHVRYPEVRLTSAGTRPDAEDWIDRFLTAALHRRGRPDHDRRRTGPVRDGETVLPSIAAVQRFRPLRS